MPAAQKSSKSSPKKGEKKLKKKVRADVAQALKGGSGDLILRQSQYFKTVADPYQFRGVKIPDLTMYPSVTFSVTDRRQITVSSSGVAYVCYGFATLNGTGSLPYGALVPSARSTTANSWIVGSFSDSTAVPAINPAVDMFPSGTTPPANVPFTFKQWSGSAVPAVQSLFQKVRLVSGIVSLDYAGTDFDNAGTITAAYAPRNSIIKTNCNTSVANPLATFQNLPDSVIVPVNKNKGASVRYRPQDFKSLDYTDMHTVYNDGANNGLLSYEETLGGEIYMIVTGATATKVFQVTATFNYEAIPLFNTIDLFSSSTSKSDPLELSATFNALEAVSPVSMGTDDALGDNHPLTSMGPNESAVDHQGMTSLSPEPEGLMDQVFSAVTGGGKMKGGLGGAIKSVVESPLLEAALAFL